MRGLPLVVASTGYSSLWCVGFSLRGLLCGAQAPGTQASVVTAPGLSCGSAGPRMWVQKLWHMAIVALQHVGSSWARNRTRVSCIGRRILYLGSPKLTRNFSSAFTLDYGLSTTKQLPKANPETLSLS